MPASYANCVMRKALSEVSSAGLTTTELPAASAGATFQAYICAGKFHGNTAPTTPMGSFVIRPRASWPVGAMRPRSEEHTSELQSLMRISYAVFFLTQKHQLS